MIYYRLATATVGACDASAIAALIMQKTKLVETKAAIESVKQGKGRRKKKLIVSYMSLNKGVGSKPPVVHNPVFILFLKRECVYFIKECW